MVKPVIPDVIPLVKDYYALPNNGAGGSLHIVLDDGNVQDSSIIFCLDICKKNNDEKGIKLCNLLLRMSKTQRRKLYMMPHT